MYSSEREPLRVAILDMYDGAENQGMRCLRQILRDFSEAHGQPFIQDEFDVRRGAALPDLSYDIFISTGGPGSPLESGEPWEASFFSLLDEIQNYNSRSDRAPKKPVLFICHSFQLACRHFDIAEVSKRKSTAFGVFPIHFADNAGDDPLFRGLSNPFYAVDSRDFQVTSPNANRLAENGGSLLAIEKERPHVALERAIMAIRFNEFMVGTQFHPEADAEGMSIYLQTTERKKIVVDNHGEDKWQSMIDQLSDPDKIRHTYAHVLPNFLTDAVHQATAARV